MKKNSLLFFYFILSFLFSTAQDSSGKLSTPWTEKVDEVHPLNEYPRPQMVRNTWINLNGFWNYKIEAQTDLFPTKFDGKILVPFAVESALSRVTKKVGKDSILWYSRLVDITPAKNKKLLLHFGAVDWRCEVFVNGKKAGMHEGGYDPFSFDITSLLKKGKQQQIVLKVWDPTNDGPQPRGKQVKNPNSIWYTSVTGVWQTVWAEAVPITYIESTKQIPDIDAKQLAVSVSAKNIQTGDEILITAWDGEQKISEKTSNNSEAVLPIPNPKLWSPEHPFLYKLKISIVRKGKSMDEVASYFAMRKISLLPDATGVLRLALNNHFQFQYGPLDQGWWPDGLYTAPTDDALKFDIEKTKEMGFNMIRKHVKVEPARWYYYCDLLGMLVWQDMPSGDLTGGRWDSRPGIVGIAADVKRTEESEAIYRKEWNAIIDALYNFPSIVVWVPFNEGWGQFKTSEISEWTAKKDPSRLVNSASGGNFYYAGHIIDLHNYPEPAMPEAFLFGGKQAIVLGEFGGLGLPLPGHTWQAKNNWGYQSYKNPEELFSRYKTFVERLQLLIQKGLSAAVYTQTTDVEIEVNGLMTYDRKIIKMGLDSLQKINSLLYKQ